MGIVIVNVDQFGVEMICVVVGSYDVMVMVGIQGYKNYQKIDCLFDLVKDYKILLIFFVEGGGGCLWEDFVIIVVLEN